MVRLVRVVFCHLVAQFSVSQISFLFSGCCLFFPLYVLHCCSTEHTPSVSPSTTSRPTAHTSHHPLCSQFNRDSTDLILSVLSFISFEPFESEMLAEPSSP